VGTITEEIKLNEIIRSQKFHVQTLKYDEDGCLMLVEDQ
jgi:ATP-dependent RNA helicase DeaD